VSASCWGGPPFDTLLRGDRRTAASHHAALVQEAARQVRATLCLLSTASYAPSLGYCGPGPGRGPMRSGRAVDVEADATALLVEAAVLVDPPSLERPRWREVARGRECQVSGMRRWRGRPNLLCRSGSGRGRRDAPRGCRRREVVWQRRGQGRARAAKRRARVEGCWARPRRRRRRGCRRRRRGTRGL
jgi:hypothetical protein